MEKHVFMLIIIIEHVCDIYDENKNKKLREKLL